MPPCALVQCGSRILFLNLLKTTCSGSGSNFLIFRRNDAVFQTCHYPAEGNDFFMYKILSKKVLKPHVCLGTVNKKKSLSAS